MRTIPILTFHALEDDETPISFAPKLFERALTNWKAGGWRTIALNEAVRLRKAGSEFPERTFVITFDDGYASVYQHGFPVMQSLGMTATVFVAPNVERAGDGWTPMPSLYARKMLGWDEIREMHAQGFTFGGHSLTHRDLRTLMDDELEKELRGSQEILADFLGERISLFAYPFGKYDGRVREKTAETYDAACSVRLGLAGAGSDLFALERVEMFYLRAPWAADAMMRGWFPLYLSARNVPRGVRKILSPSAAEIARPGSNVGTFN